MKRINHFQVHYTMKITVLFAFAIAMLMTVEATSPGVPGPPGGPRPAGSYYPHAGKYALNS